MEIETQMDFLVLLALLAHAALAPALYVRLDQGPTHEIAQPAQLLDQGVALFFQLDPGQNICHGSDLYQIHEYMSTTFT